MKNSSLDLTLLCATSLLVSSLLSCSGDNGQIDAHGSFRVEFPEAVANAAEFPILLTISLGPQSREENQGSQSAQREIVLCRSLESFVIRDAVRLTGADCHQEDVYARATVRAIQLEDPEACDQADTDGILSEAEYERNAMIFAEASTFAFSEKDCGPQNGSFDLKLKKLER